MAKEYGKTWWGQQWLNALRDIDYSNRIPRGATYARKGMVKDMQIVGNNISASVDGSLIIPYSVSIDIPRFTDNEVSALMDAVEKHPGVISRLLNRELDPDIFRIAEDLNIHLFPKRWDDLDMSCSCPDWAVPCKHLAAVIFLMAREIDNNPFLIFKIHGLDFVKELKKRGISIEQHMDNDAVDFKELLIRFKSKENRIFHPDNAYINPDFTKIPSLEGALIELLPEETPFDSHVGFRNKYAIQLNRISKSVNQLLSGKIHDSGFFNTPFLKPLKQYSRFSFNLNNEMSWDIRKVTISGEKYDDVFYTRNELLRALYVVDSGDIEFLQPSVVAMRNVLFMALHLLAKGAVIPQIVKRDHKTYQIRWLPALLDNNVRALMQQLEESVPNGLLTVVPEGRKLSVMLKNQGEWLVSLVLGSIIRQFSTDFYNDSLMSFFFWQEPSQFNQIGDASLGPAINVWLDRFYLSQRKYVPVIKVDEAENETAFHLHISVDQIDNPEVLPVSLNEIMSDDKYHDERYSILREVSLLSGFIPGLNHYIDVHGRQPIGFNATEFAPFLLKMIPAIRLLNVRVLLPKSLKQLLKPQPTLRISKSVSSEGGFLKLNDLLDFDWQVAMGNQLIDATAFMELTGKASGLLKYKGQYFYVDEADTQRILKAITSEKKLSGASLLQIALAEEYQGAPVELTDEVRNLIAGISSDTEVIVPQGLDAQLRPYQLRGYSWMYRNSRIGFGCVLADDMGLGKTIQVLAFLMKMKEDGLLTSKKRALIVVPSSLLFNWQMEISRFTPSLTSFLYHGSSRNCDRFDHDLMITSYGVLRSDNEILKKKKWLAVVIDEAQNIKNVDTARSKAIRSIKAEVKIAMSGTPVENRLSEFWSIMDFANKGYLGSAKSFNENFSKPIQIQNDKNKAEQFRKITAPFMLRRLKTDKRIISDLPEKIEQNEYCRLSASQTALYQSTLENAMTEIEGIDSGDHQSLFKRQGMVLQMILALKQICNHPGHFLKSGNIKPEESGKTMLFLDLINRIWQRNEKVIVFTQFREMGEMLVKILDQEFEEKPMFFHGGCSLKQREEMVTRFQENRNDKIFVLSLKAAGTGLNLTAASHVIHYDLWWNPAVEAQATDRAYRIGQTKNVFVHRIITKDTFEERIDEMIQQKKDLAEMTVSTGEQWIGKLNNKELRELFTNR